MQTEPSITVSERLYLASNENICIDPQPNIRCSFMNLVEELDKGLRDPEKDMTSLRRPTESTNLDP